MTHAPHLSRRHALPTPLAAVLPVPLAALLLGSCVGTQATAPGASAEDPDLARVQEALAREDWVEARESLVPLLVRDQVTRARAALAEGDARAALDLLELPLELTPKDPDLWVLRGEAALATAEGDSQPQFYYEDAVRCFEEAFKQGRAAQDGGVGPREVTCLFQLSRARRMLLDVEGALTLARNAKAALDALDGATLALPAPPARICAQASFDAYVAARQRGEAAEPLFFETEDHLGFVIADEDHRRWGLDQLANLHQWRGDLDGARVAVEQALSYEPEDGALHQRWTGLLSLIGGRPLVREQYARWTERFPSSPLGAWYVAVTDFESALEDFSGGSGDAGAFQAAEKSFRRARGLSEDLASSCLSYEACCRSAVGFVLLNADDLAGAEASFRSMEDLFEGGMTIALGERLPNGWAGLEFLLGKWAAMGQEIEPMRNAARLADDLFATRPDRANDANNAGFFNRDLGVLLHAEVLANSFPERAEEILAEAYEVMERSWAAYQRAAELAPEDIRVVNDAGLVMTYYLRSDLDAAERLLEQARTLGDESLGGLSATERQERGWADPIEAWGDAYQNLGILHLTSLDDPAGARPYLQRALEIGPPRRAQLVEALLPIADAMSAGEEVPDELFDSIVWRLRRERP